VLLREDRQDVKRARIAAAVAVVGLGALVAAVSDESGRARDIDYAAALCGGSNRWDVKTLGDLRAAGAQAPKLKRNAERRTIHYLVTQEHGPIGKHTPRLPGVERVKYVLKDVALVEAKVEEDQDVHLAIRDDQGETVDHMIVEFPNVACNVTAPTRYKNEIAQARADVVDLTRDCRTGFKKGWAQFRPRITATIRGVGFFDLVHGSELHGVAANEVELHPVLAFHGAC
jgi:hypothetical protein